LLSILPGKPTELTAHIKPEAAKETPKESFVALWKGLPVFTRRDDHPREQNASLGMLELSDEVKAQVHGSTMVGLFLDVRKEGIYDNRRYRVEVIPGEESQGK
jgi:hypothetical protein